MSIHMLVAAAYLEELTPGVTLRASTKLVLMAFADSSDEHTLESAPGMPKLRAWSGLRRSSATDAVRALADAGLLTNIVPGRLGRRAVYRVFPGGVPPIPRPSEVAARFTDPAEAVDNSSQEGPPQRPLGADSPSPRGRSTGPLHAVTSVSTRERNGFPGARPPAEDAQGIRRRAHGANDVACTIHPDNVVPCGRCANAAANADPAKVATALQLARAAARDAALTNTATPKGKP